jgi:hypothetical protein
MKKACAQISAVFLCALAGASLARAESDGPRVLIPVQFGIRIDESAAVFSDDELGEVYALLSSGPLAEFPHAEAISAIAKKKDSVEQYLEYGDYDEDTQMISIVDRSPHFSATFIHEYFHAVAARFPRAFEDFEKAAGWSSRESGEETIYRFRSMEFSDYQLEEEGASVVKKLNFPVFPSDYSKLGPDEMFAECGAATTLSLERQGSDLYRLDVFSKTSVYQWMLNFIRTGASGYR